MPPSQDPIINSPQSEPVVAHPPHRPWIIAVGVVLLGLVVAVSLYWAMSSTTEPAVKAEPVKIGMLGFMQQREAHTAFKVRMAELGYVDGENVIYDETMIVAGPNMIADINANMDRLLDPASDIDMLWLSLEMQAKVAVDKTKERGLTTPIVFISRFHDPVDYGLVASYRSSGNNATGVASNLFDIVQKHLEFFKEIDPNIKTLGVFTDGFWVPVLGDKYFAEIIKQAPQFGITVKEYKTTAPPPEAEKEFKKLAPTIKKGDIDALLHIAGHAYEDQQVGELELATRLGIPHAAPFEDLLGGGHFSYSDIFGASAAQSATLVDKIIRGAQPSDIPIEYGAHSELWLVMDRAKATGLTFPDSMLFKAAQKFESAADIPRP